MNLHQKEVDMLTGIEWIVLIFAIAGLIKTLVIIISPKKWLPVVNTVYNNRGIFTFFFLALAAIILYVLLQEMTIVQIVAGGAFFAILSAMVFLAFASDMKQLATKMVGHGIKGWVLFYAIIWVLLFAWALLNIFR